MAGCLIVPPGVYGSYGQPLRYDPSATDMSKCQLVALSTQEFSQFQAATGAFDYAYAAGVWSIAFSTVVGLYFMSHGIGLVLGMIRRR